MKQLSRKCVALLLTLMLLVSNIGIVALGEETVQPAEPAHVHTSDETAFLVLNGVDTDGAEAPAAVQEAEEAPAAEEPQEAPAAEEAPVAEEAPEAPAAEEPAAEPAQPQAEPEEKPAENMDPIEQAIQQAVAEAEQDLIRIAQEASVQQEPAPAEPAEEAPQAEEAADEAPQAEEAKEEEIADEAPEAEEAEEEEIADEAPDAEVAEEEEIADEAPDAEEAEEEEIADEAPDAEEAEEEEIVDEAPEAEEAEEEEIADEAPEAEEIEEEEAIEDEAPIVTEEMTEEVPGDVTDDPAAALGGDDCTHDNAYERSFEYRYEYDDVDNSVHTTHEIYVATIYCPDCDQIIGTREEEMNTWQSSHEWDENGVCPLCGRINTCTHGWTTTREYWVDEEAVQTVYQDELYHKSIGTAVVYTHCWDCGMDYNRATVENYEMDYVSVHEWDDNNVCTICGETNTCQHPRYSFEYNWLDEENNQYRPLDESRHTVIGKAEHYSVCSQCGAKFDVTISDNYQISSWHNWGDDSVCTTCGYTCQHLNTWSYWEWIEQQTAQDTGSDYQHQMTGKVRIQIYCSSCGTTIETIEKEVSTNLEHNYNGGTCAACGHVCNHPDLTTEYYTEDGYEAVTTPVDSLHHKTVVTYAAHEHEYCPLCGYSQDTGESTIVSEEHVRSHGYDREEKKCTACGYEFDSCPHLDIYEYVEDWKDVKYQQAGTTDYHRVIGTAVVVYKCYQCGETVSTLTVNNYEANEPHDFNSDGVCVDCGMVDKYHCTHSKTHTSHYLYAAFPTYTYLDLKSHQVTGDFVYQEICDICGTTLSRTLKTNVTEQEEHEWLDEGVCRYCAAINECPHENAIELRYNDSSEILVTEIDGQLYEVYDQVTHKYCPDCGRNFGEQTKRVQVPHQHTWKGQKCIMCGAINTCTHDGTFEVTGELWQESTRTYQRNDDKTHIVSGEGYYYLQCSVCGLKVNKDREEGKVEIQEEHTFKDGVCTRCGQKEAVQAPAKPTGVSATLSGRKAVISWKKSSRATSYSVYGGPKGSLALLKSGITGTSYKSANQTYGTAYQYYVVAVNEGGSSANSAKLSVTAMKAPASVAVTVSARKATVTWKKVTGATSYSVYGGKAGSLKLLKSGITTTSYKSANQTYGKTYEYYVVANNAGGSSANSATVSAIALKASASLTAASTSKGAVLTWKAVTGATGYEVLKDGKVIKKITKATTLTYTDKSAPKAGKKCTYAVRPIAKVAYSTVETSVKFIRVGTIGKVTLKNTAKKLTISWAKVTGATSYEVYYSTSSKKPTASTKPTKTVTATSLTVKNPTKNKTYYVFVRPVGKNGSTKTYGDWSAVAKLKITK